MQDSIINFGLKISEILLIPLVLLLLGLSIQSSVSERQEDLIVTQMVDNYFDGVAKYLVEPSEFTSPVIIARTRALFVRLRQLHRQNEIVNVLRFISEVAPEILEGDVFEQDPQSEQCFIDLSGVQLENISIGIFEIKGLRIWAANFDNSSFYNFSCDECGFSNSTFKNVDFNSVSITNSDFTGANFLGSNIEGVEVEGSIFDGAIWSNGKVCSKKSVGKCM